MAFNCSTELPHCTLSIQYLWPDPHHGIFKPYGSVQNNTDTWLSENNKYNIYKYVPRNVQQCKLKLDTNNAPHVNNLRVKPLEGAKKPICFQQHILSNSLQPVDFNLFSCGDRNQMYKMMDLRHVLLCCGLSSHVKCADILSQPVLWKPLCLP